MDPSSSFGATNVNKSELKHQELLVGARGFGPRTSCAQAWRATSGKFEPRMILATGSYLGEGFDDARLDTLFLAMPISWRGTLQQYVGRLHRLSREQEGSAGIRLLGCARTHARSDVQEEASWLLRAWVYRCQ